MIVFLYLKRLDQIRFIIKHVRHVLRVSMTGRINNEITPGVHVRVC